MKIDYHIHTLFSDGKNGLSDYVDQAMRNGIDEIGFSDHVYFEKASWSMDFEKLPNYLNEINALKRASKFPVKAGLEVDFVPSKMDGLMRIVGRSDFDYLIGSVHYIGDWQIDSEAQIHRWRGRDIDQVYQQYFALIQEMVKSKLFDIVGHLDLPKKFGFQPKNNVNSLLLETVETISKSNMCIEVSTGGLRKPCHELYPSQDLLKMCFDHTVPITLGSDAHSPEDVGADFDKATSQIRKVGYTQIVRFNKRSKEFIEF